MRKYIFLIAAMWLPFITFAQNRSESSAISIAQSFWGSSQAKLNAVPQNVINRAKARVSAKSLPHASSVGYYIVNDESNNRFVIVSADERMHTILGYSDNGIFDAESAPIGLLDMMSEYDDQFMNLSANLGEIQASLNKTSNYRSAIPPLTTSKWDQSSPYNDECPSDVSSSKGENCASGCVATAMAQVMYYYKYPVCGQGSNTYTSDDRHIYQSMDFSSVYPDWSNMSDIYDDSTTPSQKEAVAKLMHACGVSVSMDYASSSGAYALDLAYALSHFWKYSPSISYKKKQYYSDVEWEKIIYNELSEGHPILYAGSGSSGGHQFILDGFDGEGMYHFNFGWSGYGDGYYSLSILAPTYDILGFPFPLGDYTSGQEMVCYIYPDSNGVAKSEFCSKEGLRLSKATVGDSKLISGLIYNLSSISSLNIPSAPKFEGKLGVGLFDKDFNFVKSLADKNISLGGGNGTTFYGTIRFDASEFSNGKSYYIAYYAYSPETGYSIVKTDRGLEDYYLATVNGDNIIFESMKEMDQDIPIVNNIITGLYNGMTTINDESISWQINLWQDNQDSDKFWISNFDPLVKKQGYSYDIGWNKVYGYADAQGNKIEIPINQIVGPNLLLRNYSGGENITIYISDKDKTMSIDDIWGSVEQNNSSDNSSVTEFSKFSGTKFEYTTIKEDGEEQKVPTPVISVSTEHILTINCKDKDAKIYYTLNGAEPSTSRDLFTSPIELTENCTIKAIAIKNDINSDISSYTVSDFVCATPEITQENGSNCIKISCATSNAKIYYTLDNSTPDSKSSVYTKEFEISYSTIVKAIAIRDNYKQSSIASKSVIYFPEDSPEPGKDEVVVVVNTAGELSSLVSDSDKSSATRWVISGKLNGTDIKYIRSVFENEKITDLDLSNAIIVSGGESYFKIASTDYITEDYTVGQYMFANAKSLISLILPKTTKLVESYSIQNCAQLASIEIPNLCETVEDNAISSCNLLTTIHIGKDVKYFGSRNGNLCKALSQITVDSQNEYFVSVDGVLYDIDLTKLYKYPTAKADAEYDVPSTVVIIGEYAFSGAKVENVSLPVGLNEIQTGAFDNCRTLKTMVIPDNVHMIGMFAFQNCGSLTTITIPDYVEELKSFCFGYCSNLRECHLGSSVKDIDGAAFTGAVSLQSFGISEINPNFSVNDGILFSKDMSKLIRCPLAYYSEELFLNDDIETIESNAFASCTNIAKFKLPESLKEIGSSAFDKCRMEVIKIPNSVEKIGMFAFQDCDNLKSFAIPEGLFGIPTFMLSGCDALSYLYIPKGVRTIDSYAFSRCKNLTTIESWIEDFSDVNVAIGYNGDYTQYNGIAEDCTWHVPYGCVEEYKSQPWWIPTWRVIDDMYSGIGSITQDEGLKISAANGSLIIESGINTVVNIFDIKGSLIKRLIINSGITETVNLPTGIYVLNGKKIFLK